MKFALLALVSLFIIGCGKGGSSKSAPSVRSSNALSEAAICQGPAQVSGLQGTWSDFVTGAEDYIDLKFNNGRLDITYGCQTPEGGYYTDATSTRYMESANEISVNNTSTIQVVTEGGNCELENMGGSYTLHMQGQCLVLTNANQSLFFALVE